MLLTVLLRHNWHTRNFVFKEDNFMGFHIPVHLRKYRHDQDDEHIYHPSNVPYASLWSLPSLFPDNHCFLPLKISLYFIECGIIQCTLFFVTLISLGKIILKFIHCKLLKGWISYIHELWCIHKRKFYTAAELLSISPVHSFLLLGSVPLYRCTTVH